MQSDHKMKNNRSYRSPVLNYSDGKSSELSEAGITSTVVDIKNVVHTGEISSDSYRLKVTNFFNASSAHTSRSS